MAAGLILPISGPYLGTWNAKALGTQNDDGFELAATIAGQEINASDAWGMTLVEAIYRGQNWRLRFRGLEWNKAGMLDALQAYGQQGASGSLTPHLGAIGGRWTALAQALVLTAILASPPTSPQSLTATNASVAPNSTSQWNHTSKMREFPLEMALIPYSTVISTVTYYVPFTTT